mgnify:CR=1 FL=1
MSLELYAAYLVACLVIAPERISAHVPVNDAHRIGANVLRHEAAQPGAPVFNRTVGLKDTWSK